MNIIEREIATYSVKPLDRLVRREWGYFPETKARWQSEGWDGKTEQFNLDESPYAEEVVNLVGIDIPIQPAFKEEIIEVKDGYVYLSTTAGAVEQFPENKKRYEQIMPLYVRHPVESPDDWHKKIKPRLNPDTSERWVGFADNADLVSQQVRSKQKLYSANAIGGYMYLRAMMGPENTLMSFYDSPEMVHDMMKTWLNLVKTCLLKVQKKIPFFRFLIGEDISYKNGL